jgi:hypothetical protein
MSGAQLKIRVPVTVPTRRCLLDYNNGIAALKAVSPWDRS